MVNKFGPFKMSVLSAAILTANAFAQAQETEADDQLQSSFVEEEVIVLGIRQSLKLSVDDKRNANQIVDTINAEDIGKSTDQNIAEALNRVSGVSIASENGEGTTISVRGANADQTVITLNGAVLGSTEFSQGVDLSSYSADILSKVEVIKTPSADNEEGSLGGLVNLITRKPLEVKGDVRTFTAQGRYKELTEKADYKLSGTLSQKFLNDTVGIILTVSDEQNTVRRDQFHAENYTTYGSNLYTDGSTGQAYGTQAAIDAEAAASSAVNRENQLEGVMAATPYESNLLWQNGGSEEYKSIVRGIAPQQSGYQLHENLNKRTGVNATIQWQMSEKTDITLNATYNKLSVDNRQDGVFVNARGWAGHIDGVTQPNLGLGFDRFGQRSVAYDTSPVELGGTMTVDENGNPIANDPTSNDMRAWTDPQQDWHVLDPNTRSWTTFKGRHDTGTIAATVNKYSTVNNVLSLELDHSFSDALQFNGGVSITDSKRTPDQQIYMTASRGRVVGPWNLHQVPADILEPAGYDCSSGSCRVTGGSTDAFLGTNVEMQANRADLWDNIGTSGFNPDDLASHTLNFISTTVTEVTDERNTIYGDFDWDVDVAGISSLEFGAKHSSREKFVDDQIGTPAAGDERIQAISPFTGQTISLDPNNLSLIQAAIFDDGTVNPPTDFMGGLGVPQDNITDGWRRFDPVAALDAVSQGNRGFTLDGTRTRGAKIDNSALYLKANFEYFDSRLLGNVGVRYVETDVVTSGFAGSTFGTTNVNSGRVMDPILLLKMRELAGTGNDCPVLSETPSPIGLGASSEFWIGVDDEDGNPADPNVGANYNLTLFADRNRWARVDGSGYDIGVTNLDFRDDTPIAATNNGLCYDPLLEQGVLPTSFIERNITRYSDTSTDRFNYDVREVNPDTGTLVSVDRSRASVVASDTHNYNVLLPSLNLSFAISDEWVARFAASKTMSHPAIDSLRAGFGMREGSIFDANTGVRPGSTVNLYGAGLDPLESENLDFSLEWYFDEGALLGVNLFTKNITKMEEVVDTSYYIGDLRKTAANPEGASYSNGVFTLDNDEQISLLHQAAADGVPDMDVCMPRRIQGEGNLANADAILFSGDASVLCNVYTVSQRVNSDEASIEGIELQYQQSFTGLPSFLSGLGTSMNLTYQEGEVGDSGEVVPGTPKESYNATVFWSEGGHQVRLAWSGASDVLEQRSFEGGSRWREGRTSLDLSADYALNDFVSIQFNAANLTDESYRTYYTSRVLQLPDADENLVNYDEGSAINGNAPKHRTLDEYKTGVTYRLGIRIDF